MVKPIPDGYHSVTPYIIVDDAAAAINFYGKAFGATEVLRMPMGDKIGHAEIRIGDKLFRLGEDWSPERLRFADFLNGRPMTLYLSGAKLERRDI